MSQKRKIGEYEVAHALHINGVEIAIGENPSSTDGTQWLCVDVNNTSLGEFYNNGVASDNFIEIVEEFAKRVQSAARIMLGDFERRKQKTGQTGPLTSKDCLPVTADMDLENKVVVIGTAALYPEYHHPSYQLMRCHGGFGIRPNARGRQCYGYYCYDDSDAQCQRQQIIGWIPDDQLPNWAQKKEEVK